MTRPHTSPALVMGSPRRAQAKSGETSRRTSLTMTELEAQIRMASSGARRPSQRLLVRATALHDQVQVVLVLEDAEILEGIALHYEEVRVLSRLDGADPILHAEDLRVDAGGGEQHLHGLHDLGLQLELGGALSLHVAEEIGARADLAAGPVGLSQPLHGELACRVDLLELVLAHSVGLALAPDGLVGDHGRHQIGAGLPDLARPRLVEQVAVFDAAHPRL